MDNCGRVLTSCATQNSTEESLEARLEDTNSSALGTNSSHSIPSSIGYSFSTSPSASANSIPQALTLQPPLRSISNSMSTENTWVSSTDPHVHHSMLTPPYTPQTVHPEIASMASPRELNGELTEENNNMDENSNDQQYNQYSHFHHQHFMEQQAQALRERELNATVQHQDYFRVQPQIVEHRPNEAHNHRMFPVSQVIDQNHVQEPVMNSHVLTHSIGNEVHEQRSVRPKVTASAHRRMSLNPQLSTGSSQFAELSAGSLLQNSTTVSALRNQDSGLGTQASYFVNHGRESHKRPQRRRSCDSGIAHLLRHDNSPDERDNVQYLPTLPRPPHLSATAENRGYAHEHITGDGELPRSYTATEREAQMLLYNFTREEISREHLAVPHDIAQVQGLEEYNLIRAGSELRKLADAFEATPARSKVRLMAQDVLWSDITWENFMSLCMQLFSGPRGITAERIVALFTFIADIAKEQIRRGAESCIRQLMTWSLRFIFQRVCQWVDSAGGWGRVLQQGLDVVYKVAVSVLAGVAVVALAAFISRTWRS